MDTQDKRAGPNSLPESYWIENVNPGHATDEWIKLWKIASHGDDSKGSYRWYKVGKTSNGNECRESRPTDGLPIILYEQWKAAILNEPVEYKVGDYVVIKEDVSQIGEGDKFKNEIAYQVGNISGACVIKLGGQYCTLAFARFRHATQQEISAAMGVQKEDYSIAGIIGKAIWIACKTEQESKDVVQLLISKGKRWIANNTNTHDPWKLYKEKLLIGLAIGGIHNTAAPAQGTTITAQQFLAANGQSTTSEQSCGKYEKGQWVVILKSQGGHPEGTIIQIDEVRTSTDQVKCSRYVNNLSAIRPATPEEVSKAGGSVVDKWKVGDRVRRTVCPGGNISIGDTGTIENVGAQLGVRWDKSGRYECCAIKYAEKIPVGAVVPGTNIGRKVRIKGWEGEYEGQIGIVTDCAFNKKYGSNQVVAEVRMSDGKILNPFTPAANKPQCEWVTEHSKEPIPVTADNARVGMKVWCIESYQKHYSASTAGSREGKIVDLLDGIVRVKWKYQELIAKYDELLIAPDEQVSTGNQAVTWNVGDIVERLPGDGQGFSQNIPAGTRGTIHSTDSLGNKRVGVNWDNGDQYNCLIENLKQIVPNKQSNQLTNKQPKTTNNEYREQQHTGKRSRWDIILPDSEEPIISRSGSRTGTAGYCGGELPAVKCGYQRFGKGIKGGQEDPYIIA